MNEQAALQNLLRKKLAELQARNPSFSVRAFAKRLGLQASATNEILKGERRISFKMAERIASRLLLDPSERNELLKLFPVRRFVRKTAEDNSKEADILKLSADQFEAISDWSHYAILSLVKLKDFRSDETWIAQRLGITDNQARSAVERLIRLGLLKRTESGVLKRSHARFHTSDDVLNPAIQKSHLEDMELARQSLLRDPIEVRDFTSMTMAVSLRLLPKAKELIRKAQDEILELLESEPSSEVYRMSVYLYPLTRPGNRPKASAKKE